MNDLAFSILIAIAAIGLALFVALVLIVVATGGKDHDNHDRFKDEKH